MRDDQKNAPNLPSDSHLKEDISIPSDMEEETQDHFTPGQTNAGQQVSGLASATNYGDDQDPESGKDSNHPV